MKYVKRFVFSRPLNSSLFLPAAPRDKALESFGIPTENLKKPPASVGSLVLAHWYALRNYQHVQACTMALDFLSSNISKSDIPEDWGAFQEEVYLARMGLLEMTRRFQLSYLRFALLLGGEAAQAAEDDLFKALSLGAPVGQYFSFLEEEPHYSRQAVEDQLTQEIAQARSSRQLAR